MSIPLATKDPNAILTYGFDYTDWLDTGDALATSVWTVPVGITDVSEAASPTITSVKVSGGTLGKSYEIVNDITTTKGLTERRRIVIEIQKR